MRDDRIEKTARPFYSELSFCEVVTLGFAWTADEHLAEAVRYDALVAELIAYDPTNRRLIARDPTNRRCVTCANRASEHRRIAAEIQASGIAWV